MNYYKAQEQDTLPYLTFEQVAIGLAELELIGLENDPLVVPESRLTNAGDPDYISYHFGICNKRIVNGELVNALAHDISLAEANLAKAMNVETTKLAGAKFDSRTFAFGGKDYPLNSSAITIYKAVVGRGTDNSVMSTTGAVLLKVSDLLDFEDAMNDAIIAISNEGMMV